VDSFSQAVVLKANFSLLPDLNGFEGQDPPVQIRIEDVQLEQPRLVYEGIVLTGNSVVPHYEQFDYFSRHSSFSIQFHQHKN
jgi:hypothetical protein